MTVFDIVIDKTINLSVTSVEREIAVAEAEQSIKNYCNIDSVPQELIFTWANMSVDLLRYQHEINMRDSGGDEDISVHSSDITSLKIGDTSVNVGSGSETNTSNRVIKSHKPSLDELIMNYREQLNKFRRMVW